MSGATAPRARDLDIPFDGLPGELNAITDVAGVEVGHTTIIEGAPTLPARQGPARTGVTAIHPRGRRSSYPCFAGWFSLNGNGEMTGTPWIDEAGLLDGPIVLTNTHSVGVARDAVVRWMAEQGRLSERWGLPVVAETYDGWLNDINGFHVTAGHVLQALNGARGGPVAEGSVGGGTGMVCHGFKGGIGTASRRVEGPGGPAIVGALVQANHGSRDLLRIAGIPVGRELIAEGRGDSGSIIVILGTDAPMIPNQLRALARRAALGLARTGSVAAVTSGDLFLAFSTGNLAGAQVEEDVSVLMMGLNRLTPMYRAAVEATEEAIVNALVAAETMTGVDGHTAERLPHREVQQILRRHGVLRPSE